MDREILIYSSAYCWYCNRAKKILSQRGLPFREIRIDLVEEERLKLLDMCGRMTVPQIFVGETHVGGCDDLEDLIGKGELDDLLSEQGISPAESS